METRQPPVRPFDEPRFAVCKQLLYRVAEPYDEGRDCKLYTSEEEAKAFQYAEVEYAKVGSVEVTRHPREGIPLELEAKIHFGEATEETTEQVNQLRQAELLEATRIPRSIRVFGALRKALKAEAQKRFGEVTSMSVRQVIDAWRKASRPARNHDVGWKHLSPVVQPVHRLSARSLPPTLVETMPLAKVVSSFSRPSVEDEVRRALAGKGAPYACFLGDEWRFREIWTKARDLPGFQYPSLKWDNIGQILVSALHALETTLHRLHPNLEDASVANFWCSWQVHAHLANYAREVGNSPTARSIEREVRFPERMFPSAQEEAWRAAYHLSIFLEAFATDLILQADPDLTNEPTALVVDECATETERRVRAYIVEVLKAKNRLLTFTDIWREAGYKHETMFRRYRKEKNCSATAKANFDRILREKPHLKK